MRAMVTARFTFRATGASVTGHIQPADERDLLAWTRWQYRRSDKDRTWDWWGIYLECKLSAGRYECFAARVGPELHGLMVLDLKGRRVGGLPALIVDYLATNPVNRTASHGLKQVGTALMAVAASRSTELGMAGGIWLECLEGAQMFYENLGMVGHFRRSEEGRVIYTLDAKGVKELLEQIKEKRILKT